MRRTLAAVVVAALFVPTPARAAAQPILDIGLVAGTVVNGPIVLRPTFAAGADIRSVTINASTAAFEDLSQGASGAPSELRWDPLYFLDQDVKVSLIAIDSAGTWTETAPVTVYVDKAGPTYRTESLTPAGWEWHVSIHRPIVVHATDRGGLSRVELLQNGKVVRSVGLGNKTSGRASLALDPATKNGRRTFTIRVTDRFGNITAHDYPEIVDNDPPTGVFRPSGTLLRGTVEVWPYELRDNTFVVSMSSYLDNRKGGGTTNLHSFKVPVNTRVVKDGKHTLTVELTDLAGNVGVTKRTVTVDNTLPTVSYGSAPKNKAKLTKKVTLKARAGDKYGVAKVQLLVNGKVAGTDTKAGYQFTLDPKKYGKSFTVQLRAYDKAGNVRYSAKRSYRR